jgi:programmed cell death protein 4
MSSHVDFFLNNQKCLQAGIINDDIVRKMPSRGRKRFVSEGDGGLIKDSSFW